MRARTVETETFFAPKVLGKYVFGSIDDGQGGNATALLFAVPQLGRRADNMYLVPLLQEARSKHDIREDVAKLCIGALLETLRLTGVASADLHRAGAVHRQMGLGNVLPMMTKRGDNFLYVADWETADFAVPEADMPLAAMFDVKVSMQSYMLAMRALHREGAFTGPELYALAHAGLTKFVEGHTNIPAEAALGHARKHEEQWDDTLGILFDTTVNKRSLQQLPDLYWP